MQFSSLTCLFADFTSCYHLQVANLQGEHSWNVFVKIVEGSSSDSDSHQHYQVSFGVRLVFHYCFDLHGVRFAHLQPLGLEREVCSHVSVYSATRKETSVTQ